MCAFDVLVAVHWGISWASGTWTHLKYELALRFEHLSETDSVKTLVACHHLGQGTISKPIMQQSICNLLRSSTLQQQDVAADAPHCAAEVSADTRPALTAACRRSSSCSCFRCCVTSAPKENTSICRAVSLSMPLDLRARHALSEHCSLSRLQRFKDPRPAAMHTACSRSHLRCSMHSTVPAASPMHLYVSHLK